MVRDAPSTGEAVASFLEFARGAVLVAHNAGFDIGFLKAACAAHDLRWPGPTVLDTVRLARQVVSRDEVPNHKLGTLARYFGATTTPDHRALHDARATVDVLHALVGRLGSVGVHTLEELSSYTSRVSDELRRKRHLADGLPSAPGVYVFKDANGQALYVGTSVDIRKRVRSYFTESEKRARMRDMVRLAEEVTPVVCQTALEAQVRELRLIAEHKPRYNRRSRHPEKAAWVKFTVEPNEVGKGFAFESAIVGGAVPKEYIPGVEKGIKSVMDSGPLAGFPVIDFKVALIDGAFHDVDSSVLAFEIASRAAMREGLKKDGAKLLAGGKRLRAGLPAASGERLAASASAFHSSNCSAASSSYSSSA